MASAGMGSLLVELVERKRKADEAKATADAAAEAAGGVTAAEVGGVFGLLVCVCGVWYSMEGYGCRTNHNRIQYTTPHHTNRRRPPPWWRR